MPSDVSRDMEVRRGQRSAKRLELRRATASTEWIVDRDDFVLGAGRDGPAASEQSFPQHAVRTESRLGRGNVRGRTVGVEEIEDRIRPLGRKEFALDIAGTNAPSRLHQVAGCARSPV